MITMSNFISNYNIFYYTNTHCLLPQLLDLLMLSVLLSWWPLPQQMSHLIRMIYILCDVHDWQVLLLSSSWKALTCINFPWYQFIYNCIESDWYFSYGPSHWAGRIGIGYSINVPNYNPSEIVANLKRMIKWNGTRRDGKREYLLYQYY